MLTKAMMLFAYCDSKTSGYCVFEESDFRSRLKIFFESPSAILCVNLCVLGGKNLVTAKTHKEDTAPRALRITR